MSTEDGTLDGAVLSLTFEITQTLDGELTVTQKTHAVVTFLLECNLTRGEIDAAGVPTTIEVTATIGDIPSSESLTATLTEVNQALQFNQYETFCGQIEAELIFSEADDLMI